MITPTGELVATAESLKKVQSFDVSTLARKEELGSTSNFEQIVPTAGKLVSLFQKIPATALHDFPVEIVTTIKQYADTVINIFTDILEYKPDSQNIHKKEEFEKLVRDFCLDSFEKIGKYAAYASSAPQAIEGLKAQAAGNISKFIAESREALDRIKVIEDSANQALEEVRDAAAEKGVSQQAHYFDVETEINLAESGKWLDLTTLSGASIFIYTLALFFYNEIFKPEYNSIYQFMSSATPKVLMFSILIFSLYFSAKNYYSSKHNATINKHRRNALLTYREIVTAATPEQKDIILRFVASCIFSPQTTGYSSASGGNSPTVNSAVELLMKPISDKSPDPN